MHTHTHHTTPSHACLRLQAGPDGIVHVLMTTHDLSMRRADTVVRDLPGASHLLDLYSCKRVDKRKVRASQGNCVGGGERQVRVCQGQFVRASVLSVVESHMDARVRGCASTVCTRSMGLC